MFNLIAANQEVILTSQMYRTRQNAEEGIAAVAHNAALRERYEREGRAPTAGLTPCVLHAANHL